MVSVKDPQREKETNFLMYYICSKPSQNLTLCNGLNGLDIIYSCAKTVYNSRRHGHRASSRTERLTEQRIHMQLHSLIR